MNSLNTNEKHVQSLKLLTFPASDRYKIFSLIYLPICETKLNHYSALCLNIFTIALIILCMPFFFSRNTGSTPS